MIIRCGRCGRIIGSMESYSYGGPEGEDHIDYREPNYNEDYGGERDGDSYCEGCFSEELAEARLAGEED